MLLAGFARVMLGCLLVGLLHANGACTSDTCQQTSKTESVDVAEMPVQLLQTAIAMDSSETRNVAQESEELTSQSLHLADGSYALAAQAVAKLGRFQLLERITEGNSSSVDRENLLKSLKYGTNVTWLGNGSYAEVWRAFDRAKKKEVALKLFIGSRDKDGWPTHYLSWANATEKQREVLKLASTECNLQRRLLKEASRDPAGAAHIGACLENHIQDKGRGASKLLAFVIMPVGGRMLGDLIKHGNLDEMRQITVQLLLALRFLNSFDPPIVHHDVNPHNVVYTRDADGRIHIQLIDFGGSLQGTMSNSNRSCDGTDGYAPPEWTVGVAFVRPWYSYDMFAAGMMHLELLCPTLDWHKLNSHNRHGRIIWNDLSASLIREVVHTAQDHHGNLTCSEVGTDEIELIAGMVGEASGRPSPSKALAFPLFKKLVAQDSLHGVFAELQAAEEPAEEEEVEVR